MQTQPTPVDGVLLDRRGRRRSAGNTSGVGLGSTPGNKGREFGPEPPTAEEIMQLLHACSTDAYGMRLHALVILLWRTGLRINEALALTEHDLSADANSILVRHGKGNKRRTIGMDDWAWREIAPWLEHRRTLPIGALFCVLTGSTAGRAVSDSVARRELHRLGAKAGVRKRVAPHQFRHAFATEMDRGGMRLSLLSRQLGHANIGVTAIYLQSISHHEVTEYIGGRPVPTVPLRTRGR